MADAPKSGPRARVMIVMEDGGVFLAITRPGESVVRVPLSQRDLLRLVGEAARAVDANGG
ncbi:hypothetical protein [Pararhodobacter sp.]|uniref:hypothetical protein n=1 Tax=Pararhodobacter sp. TaxID=2127056 RepID=UPI002AFE0C6E|nr:hypothetical protein [Pararhodobacter sp.]